MIFSTMENTNLSGYIYMIYGHPHPHQHECNVDGYRPNMPIFLLWARNDLDEQPFHAQPTPVRGINQW